jgi:hypothetical protein
MKRVMIADTCSIEKYPPSPGTGNVPLFYAIAGKRPWGQKEKRLKRKLFTMVPAVPRTVRMHILGENFPFHFHGLNIPYHSMQWYNAKKKEAEE